VVVVGVVVVDPNGGTVFCPPVVVLGAGVVAVDGGATGVVCPGTVEGTIGAEGAVVVALGTGAVTGGGTTAGGAVSTTAGAAVVAAGVAPLSFVSFTNAKASSAPASSTIAPMATVGSCQLGVWARRVRAGAPHSRHQS
jgi:hypothetical protein